MIAEYKRKSNWGVGFGLLALLVGNGISRTGGADIAFLGEPLILVGLGLFVWGCVSYAQAKGRHPALGALGLLSIFGLLVLVCLKDQAPEQQPVGGHVPAPPPPPPGSFGQGIQ